MSDISFAFHILASTVAICAAYALLMSILKKEVSAAWIRGEAILALLSSGVAIGLSYRLIFQGEDIIYLLSLLILLLGLGNALALVIVNQFKLTREPLYPKAFIPLAKTLSILMFSSFLLSFLLELAAISRL